MDIRKELLGLMESTLHLEGRSAEISDDTPLLGGNLPEFDSIGVVSLIGAMEDHFGIIVEDEEIAGDIFHSLGKLVEFLKRKLEG